MRIYDVHTWPTVNSAVISLYSFGNSIWNIQWLIYLLQMGLLWICCKVPPKKHMLLCTSGMVEDSLQSHSTQYSCELPQIDLPQICCKVAPKSHLWLCTSELPEGSLQSHNTPTGMAFHKWTSWWLSVNSHQTHTCDFVQVSCLTTHCKVTTHLQV